MTAQPRPSLTETEYLERERANTIKHEYHAGEVFAMAGGSEAHNLIASNVNASIYAQIRGRGCRIYPGDMRIKIVNTGLYTYPDLTIVCGTPEFTHMTKRDTLLNPTIIIEILSPSTERYETTLDANPRPQPGDHPRPGDTPDRGAVAQPDRNARALLGA
jgi:Uma2 family endonuclease